MSSASSSSSLIKSGATPQNKVVLVSIDGYGLSDEKKGNAIAAAKKPTMDELSSTQLSVKIDASGFAVGLPKGVMGNSEVGHLTMGAGRVQFQDLVRINQAVEEKTFANIPTLVQAFKNAKAGNGRVHFLGLVSDGAVHSHIEHLFAFLEAAKAAGVPHSFVHFFGDGRDTQPACATKYISQLQSHLASHSYGSIATVQGRYYGMDRDKRWERIEVGYKLLVQGVGEKVAPEHLIELVEKRYAAKETDEFLKPIVVDSNGIIGDNDTLIFINFRSDRMRQIVAVFANLIDPAPFHKEVVRNGLNIYQMTQYDEKYPLPVIFPPQSMLNGLSEWIAKHNWKQFHTAETEKYAHVTFFFNGGVEKQFPLEDRALIPSPKVATYDLKPEMSMKEVAQSVAGAISKDEYPLIMTNFAAPDMVGHTGMYDKAVIAVEHCDAAMKIVWEACKQHGYTLVITADHGNAEEMIDHEGKPKTSHTTNLIPLIVAHPKGAANAGIHLTEAAKTAADQNKPVGGLSSVAPTVLTLLGLNVPEEMTGKPIVTVA